VGNIDSSKPAKIPQHVAIIMDGNRRWAAQRGLGPVDGHRYAAERAIKPLVEYAINVGIKYLTFWAFSTENWKRDKIELKGLFDIFKRLLKRKMDKLIKEGVRIRYLGEIDKFPDGIGERIREAVRESAKNDVITVTFALNYGGRDELLRAVKKVYRAIRRGKFMLKNLSEATFSQFLDTKGIPDPDLIIRTGGEIRLSGYLPWQSVYSELYFTETYFPDFTPEEFGKALIDYSSRERRFGGGSFESYKTKYPQARNNSIQLISPRD